MNHYSHSIALAAAALLASALFLGCGDLSDLRGSGSVCAEGKGNAGGGVKGNAGAGGKGSDIANYKRYYSSNAFMHSVRCIKD